MIAVLLPFFLAAQVNVKESAWQYGPEVTYLFQVNSTAVTNDDHKRSIRFNLDSKLKCRIKEENALSCQLSDTNAISYPSDTVDPSKPGSPAGPVEEHAEYQLAEDRFEVIFDRNGVSKLVVSKSVSPRELNVIRAIVNQLNFGIDFKDLRSDKFQRMEKSVIGKCDTTFHVTRNTTGAGRKFTDFYYRLTGLPHLGSRQEGEAVSVEKWRNVHQCSLRADYFFGSREGHRAGTSEVQAKLEASESSLHVTESSFGSYTFNEIVITKREDHQIRMFEYLTISLVTLEAAKKPIISINEPAFASLYAYQYLDDPAEEDDDEEDDQQE